MVAGWFDKINAIKMNTVMDAMTVF